MNKFTHYYIISSDNVFLASQAADLCFKQYQLGIVN